MPAPPPTTVRRDGTAAAEWDLDRAVVLLGAASKTELLKRIANDGFGYLLKPHLLRARRSTRRAASYIAVQK